MTDAPPPVGSRVRTIFADRRSGREGVVVDVSDPLGHAAILIEFQDYCEVEKRAYTHRKWLPSRHWTVIASATGEDSPANEGEGVS